MISALLLSFLLPLWREQEDQEGGRLNSCEFLAEGVLPDSDSKEASLAWFLR